MHSDPRSPTARVSAWLATRPGPVRSRDAHEAVRLAWGVFSSWAGAFACGLPEFTDCLIAAGYRVESRGDGAGGFTYVLALPGVARPVYVEPTASIRIPLPRKVRPAPVMDDGPSPFSPVRVRGGV